MLQGQNVVITGATGVVGSAIAQLFARQGATMILTADNQENLGDLRDVLPFCQAHVLDLTVSEDVEKFFKKINQEPLSVLVNCAGVIQEPVFSMTNLESLREQWEINVEAVFKFCQLASKLMMPRNQGVIINLASQAGEQSAQGQDIYRTTKAVLVRLTKLLSAQLGEQGIRVNAIAPGFIQSPVTGHYQESVDQTKLKRLGTPEDVANAALFLALPWSSYITGEVLSVDGTGREHTLNKPINTPFFDHL